MLSKEKSISTLFLAKEQTGFCDSVSNNAVVLSDFVNFQKVVSCTCSSSIFLIFNPNRSVEFGSRLPRRRLY